MIHTICPHCGAENPENKNFCADCGASLTSGAFAMAEAEHSLEWKGFPWAPLATRRQSKSQFLASMAVGMLVMVVVNVMFALDGGHTAALLALDALILVLSVSYYWSGRKGGMQARRQI